MDQSLVELLEKTGFTQKEAGVYLALLELGQGTVSQIAKKAALKRPIIYVILESLIKRGYVGELPNKKINTYHAADPSVILRTIKTTTRHFSEMLPFLQTLNNKGTKRPKITYHDTTEGIWSVYEEMNYAKSAFFITSYNRIEHVFPQSITNWIKNAQRGIYPLRGKHLVPDLPEEKVFAKGFIKAKQEVRTLKTLNKSHMDFTIFKNKLAITSLEEEPFIVVIESKELVKSMQPIFELAWSKGKAIL